MQQGRKADDDGDNACDAPGQSDGEPVIVGAGPTSIPRPTQPALVADLAWARSEAERFHADLRRPACGADFGANSGMPSPRYEAITERLHRAMSYGQLYFAEDMGDADRGRFLQSLQESYNAISTETLFFTLELNRLDEETVDAAARRSRRRPLRPLGPRGRARSRRTSSPTRPRSCCTISR